MLRIYCQCLKSPRYFLHKQTKKNSQPYIPFFKDPNQTTKKNKVFSLLIRFFCSNNLVFVFVFFQASQLLVAYLPIAALEHARYQVRRSAPGGVWSLDEVLSVLPVGFVTEHHGVFAWLFLRHLLLIKMILLPHKVVISRCLFTKFKHAFKIKQETKRTLHVNPLGYQVLQLHLHPLRNQLKKHTPLFTTHQSLGEKRSYS